MWSSELQQTIIQSCKTAEFRLLEPLSRHTSFRIGGPAVVMVFPKTVEELKPLLQTASAHGITPYILGAGTNVLAPDEGLQAIVICLKDALTSIRLLDKTRMEVFAGESMAKAAVFAKNHALTGLEFAAGIPGTVGGAAYMNAGAYGGELKDVVTLVTAMEQSGKTVAYTPAELQMSYRHSRFSDEAVPSVILSVPVALHPGDLETIRATIREFAARRREKQPLSVPGCGSTFKRPEGQFAGTLIDNAGLKGLRIGGASVSTLHAGFLVNDENGTAADYLALIAAVQKAVQEDSGVWLEPEVRILGEDAPVSLL